jgi:hypothetical protein
VTRRHLVATATVAIALAAGCSSSSSAGAPDASGSPVPTSANAIDRTSVDTTLSDVLHGLRALTSLPQGASAASTITGLNTASSDLKNAAGALSPIPNGVPYSTVQPVAAALLTVSNLMDDASICLSQNGGGGPGSAASCADPLRRADKATGQLARDLISLAAYGSKSPTSFEQSLVTVLHG